MKINITKKEYLLLLQILEMADWVLHAHHVHDREDTVHFREFEQKIFSFAEAMGYSHLVEYISKYKEYLTTREYEDTHSAMPFILEFENNCFWSELIDRLAVRDLVREVGEDGFDAMDWKERIERTSNLEEEYNQEFIENGLDNLTLKRT